MKSKYITYGLKAVFFIFAWFVIVVSCTGDINVSLFCISIFTYTGSVIFDLICYLIDSNSASTKLKGAIKKTAWTALLVNGAIIILVLLMNSYIDISHKEDYDMYYIELIKASNGFFELYPELANKAQIPLNKFMSCVGISALFSLLPACLLEVDYNYRVKNDNDVNNKDNGRE